jgi:NAD(P)-dependent dehydrogenase (short-subunit alcohol dehydrogenase family)
MRFAAASGDFNPMHMDPVAARRTQAGAPVVHGMHLLLWALDALAASGEPPPLRRLRVQFDKFVYLDEPVALGPADRHPDGARLTIFAGGAPVTRIEVEFGAPGHPGPEVFDAGAPLNPPPVNAQDLDFEALSNRSGRLAFSASAESVAAMFPAAADWLGRRRVASLGACTHLVGMVCPGLHSILGELKIEAIADRDPDEALAFRVTETDPRFRLVRLFVRGGGLEGVVVSFARMPPTTQPGLDSLAGLVEPNAFAGSTALIVGGSRGLGELTAKLIVAGGGRVVVTYRLGRADAEAVASEIGRAGGDCQILQFDARAPAEAQLAGLAETPSHAYYFASPPIFKPQRDLFDKGRFDEFTDVYVEGFWRLSRALSARNAAISLFYPSSVAVAERPRGMTEYAMAKAAGEALCADMNLSLTPLHVTIWRMPRLATDQTASLRRIETAPAVETLLPIVSEVQSWPRPR